MFKNERLSAQIFTRRYEMVRDTVTDRAPRAFKEQALGSRRAERASEPRKSRPQRASEPNTKHQARGRARAVRVAFFSVYEEDL